MWFERPWKGPRRERSARFPARLSTASLGIVLSSTLALTGCGGGAKSPTSASSTPSRPDDPVATVPKPPRRAHAVEPRADTVPKPGDAHAPSARPRPPRPVPDSSPEAAQPIRVPVRFVLAGGRLWPAAVSVPPFIAIELTIVSRDRAAQTLVLSTRPPRKIAVAASGRSKVTLKGVPRGSYRLAVSGGAAGTLVVGSEPGP